LAVGNGQLAKVIGKKQLVIKKSGICFSNEDSDITEKVANCLLPTANYDFLTLPTALSQLLSY